MAATATAATATATAPEPEDAEETEAHEQGETEDEEEFWPAAPLLTEHRVHAIRFGGNNNNNNNNNGCETILRYKSMPSESMTPLDMTYGSNNNKNNDCDCDDEFYDGTGNLMWMAAVCFGHVVAQGIEPLRSYLLPLPPEEAAKTKPDTPSDSSSPFTRGDRHQLRQRRRRRHRRVCELGCGTGGAGIALLLFSNNNDTDNDIGNDRGDGGGEKQEQQPQRKHPEGSCHVVFTDNDAESLELCRSNCELNGIDPKHYSHELLGWGRPPPQQRENGPQQSGESKTVLEGHSFDTILATDVVYDLKMIAPLMQTVDFLLREKQTTKRDRDDATNGHGGHLILSHVPRFCIPREEDTDEERWGAASATTTTTNNATTKTSASDGNDPGEGLPDEAFLELERFIQAEAGKVGLSLAETIRPHEVLSGEDLLVDDGNGGGDDEDSMQQMTLESMKEAHAVVFVFGRS